MADELHALSVTPRYATALAVLFLVLSVRVILARRRGDVGFGTGGSDDLARRVRVHANFAEYVPFALLLLALAELRGAGAAWLSLAGGLLLAGRLAHAVGLSRPTTDGFGRIAGMAGTQTAILLAAILLVVG